MRRLAHRLAAGLLGVAVLSGLVLVGDTYPSAVDVVPTADTGQFNPGNIISDSVFYDAGAMSVDDVRRFVELKGINCRTGSDGTPCLKDYRQDTTTRAGDAYCSTYSGGAQETAATIIWKSAQACGISAQVLLVMLQKEQSLVTNTGSSLYSRRYREAMGYACPDTAACDPAYNGFQNQVYSAARRFQVYKANPTSYGYRAGRTNTVLYNPDRACGSSQLYIQNQATASLYIYTPYQPNAAALSAGYGTGDACSAYGNRNFWLYFTDWFGSTQRPGESAWQPLGAYDSVTARTGDQIGVRGWAVDPDTSAPIAVHVYVDGQNRGAFAADADRPDLAAALPTWGSRHGFDVTIQVAQGRHEVCVFAINVGSPAANPSLGCRTVDTSNLPLGNIETAAVVEGEAALKGWTLDPDTTGPIDVHVYVNGQWAGAAQAGLDRPDVGAAHPGRGSAHGFQLTVPLRPGANEVCVFAINVGAGASNPQLGCRSLTLAVTPYGDARFAGGAESASVSGWALDPETVAPIRVHLYVDGQFAVALTADLDRPDVAAALPGVGAAHGWSTQLTMPPGTHEVCAYAINVKQGSGNPKLGCGSVLIGRPPVGHLDEAQVSGAVVRLRGWALDPDVVDPIRVHLYVDGKYSAGVTAGGVRPDIGAAFPASGPAHGLDTTVVLSPGRHQVCAFAINVLGGVGNPSLGCLTVEVPPSALPRGNVDAVVPTPGYAVLRGWAYDPDVPTASIAVHFYLDGRYAGQVLANEDRPDVGAAIAGAGNAHGYTGRIAASPGRHTVCAYAINLGGGPNPPLRCVLADVS